MSNDTPPPPELDGPLQITIGLDWFFNKFISGVQGRATVSKAYGLYLQGLDPQDTYLHVDYPEDVPNLAYVYPISFWRESVARMSEQKRRSEEERQARFAREAEARALQARYEKREDEIRRILSLIHTRFPMFERNRSQKNLRLICITLLMGKGNPAAAEKLGIDASTIEDFLGLPQPAPSEEELLLGLVVEPPQPKTLE